MRASRGLFKTYSGVVYNKDTIELDTYTLNKSDFVLVKQEVCNFVILFKKVKSFS